MSITLDLKDAAGRIMRLPLSYSTTRSIGGNDGAGGNDGGTGGTGYNPFPIEDNYPFEPPLSDGGTDGAGGGAGSGSAQGSAGDSNQCLQGWIIDSFLMQKGYGFFTGHRYVLNQDRWSIFLDKIYKGSISDIKQALLLYTVSAQDRAESVKSIDNVVSNTTGAAYIDWTKQVVKSNGDSFNLSGMRTEIIYDGVTGGMYRSTAVLSVNPNDVIPKIKSNIDNPTVKEVIDGLIGEGKSRTLNSTDNTIEYKTFNYYVDISPVSAAATPEGAVAAANALKNGNVYGYIDGGCVILSSTTGYTVGFKYPIYEDTNEIFGPANQKSIKLIAVANTIISKAYNGDAGANAYLASILNPENYICSEYLYRNELIRQFNANAVRA